MSKKYRHQFELGQRKFIPTINLRQYRDEIMKGIVAADLPFPSHSDIRYQMRIGVRPDHFVIDWYRRLNPRERQIIGAEIAVRCPALCQQAMKYVHYTCQKTGKPRLSRQLFKCTWEGNLP